MVNSLRLQLDGRTPSVGLPPPLPPFPNSHPSTPNNNNDYASTQRYSHSNTTTPPTLPTPLSTERQTSTQSKPELSIDIQSKKAPSPDAVKGPTPYFGFGTMQQAGFNAKSVNEKKKRHPYQTRFGLWSRSLAYYSSVTAMVMGFLSMVWFEEHSIVMVSGISSQIDLLVGIYTIGLGFITLILELVFGGRRTSSPVAIRALLYFITSIPQFFSWPTVLSGMFWLTCATANWLACINREAYNVPFNTPINKTDIQASSLFSNLLFVLAHPIQQHSIGILIFVMAYIASNVILFYLIFTKTVTLRQSQLSLVAAGKLQSNLVLSTFSPWAKGFGAILNLNCAIILLPMCRTFVRWLYDASAPSYGLINRVARVICFFVPVEKALFMHKVIAVAIMIGAIGHTVAHYLALADAPTAQLTAFQGSYPFVSGGLICFFMLLLYSATSVQVRKGQFELFQICHYSFVPFLVLLIVHGHGGLGPNFFKFFILPGSLYMIERILRLMRRQKEVVLLSVTMMGNVFSLEFEKSGVFAKAFKQGQYLYINCPHVSKFQWHAFTISSAPEEKTVTIHCRVMGEGSWTRQVKEYLQLMAPPATTYFKFDRPSEFELSRKQGKTHGPDGLVLFKLDGPHSAPTQHLVEYNNVLVVGAGIGATPLASTLRSVIFHRWKYAIGVSFPEHSYFAWVCSHRDVDAFRWLIRNIKEAQDEVVHMREQSSLSMLGKSFEFHIFLTSTEVRDEAEMELPIFVDDDIGFWGVPRASDLMEKTLAGWTEVDLYRAMKRPTQQHIQFEDVYVHIGRPAWAGLLKRINSRHSEGRVGVLYCGNDQIAADLKKQVFITNQHRKQGRFMMHKEIFH